MIQAGARIGPYEILSPLGAGGMGEVWRAKDTRIDRMVALKVLPEEFFEDEERRQRFGREARTLASLSHPGIALLYSFEEIGGRHLLVMELVEGEDLGQRLVSGPIPLDESLAYAKQIAEALEAAHEKGIVHRDLKPANVKVTPDGKVKLLDFGLAKVFEADSAVSSPSATRSPTLTARATAAGVILGTAAYMSPEQARGKTVDKRTDVWAFGCVLYEMLTGKRAFEGETVSDTLAAVLMRDPDWSALGAPVSSSVRGLLRRCLQRDPKQRLRDIGEARIALEEDLAGPRSLASGAGAVASASSPSEETDSPARAAATRSASTPRLQWGSVLLILGWAAAAILALLYVRRPVPAGAPLRFSIPAPAGTSYNFVAEEVAGPPALSPDGRWLVFTATDASSRSRIWLRALDSLEAKPLAGTENGTYPFWSPDSRFIGFWSADRLEKLDVLGGAPEVVCSLGTGWQTAGAWAPDGTIVVPFVTSPTSGVLYRVPASGGSPKPVTKAEPGRVHRWPSFLPDGRHFLFLSLSGDPKGDPSRDGIYVGSLDTQESSRILRFSSRPIYAPSGQILVVNDGSLLAVPFDARKLEATGEPARIADRVATDPLARSAIFTVSSNGLLAYQTSDAPPGLARLTWFDRAGKPLGTVGEPRIYGGVRRSPDGRRAAVEVWNDRMIKEIWLVEFSGGLEQRLTPGWTESPAWAPDGRRIAYARETEGRMSIREKELAGSGRDEAFYAPEQLDWTGDWSPDGRSILVTSLKTGGRQKFFLSLLSLPDRKIAPWLVTDADERDALFSPDGKWEAHGSNESGIYEICVRPFPGPGGKRQVSRSAGSQARWRGDGKELFYLSSDGKLMSVETKATAAGFEAGPPKVLFEPPVAKPLLYPVAPFDATADGQRFLVVCPVGGSTSPPLTVVVNWTAEAKK